MVALGGLLLCLPLVWVAVVPGEETPEDVLAAVVARTGVAGGVVAWGRPGEAPRVAATGLADRGTGRAMSPQDRLPIASLTKPVTAALVFARVDAGEVTLDTPLAELDAAAPPGVTVGHALGHLGGWDRRAGGDPFFRPMADLSALAGGTPVETCRDVAVLPDFAPTLPPGQEYVYSNIGYCWLGELFAPEGGFPAAASALGFDPEMATVIPDSIDPATRSWAVLQPGIAGPFGGIVTDAATYLGFALRPVDPRIFAPPPGEWETDYYGLGWRVWPRGETTYLTHYGAMPGTFSLVIRRMDGGAAVLFLNGTVEDHERLARALAELLMEMPSWQ